MKSRRTIQVIDGGSWLDIVAILMVVILWLVGLILFCLIAGAIISFVGESVRVVSMTVLLMLLLFVCIMCPDDY